VTAAATPQLSAETTALSELRQLVRECDELGARFRLCGATVKVDGLERLPEPLQLRLMDYCHPEGWMWAFLGGERLDTPAIALSQKLGVRTVLVDSRSEARAAVRTLIADIRAIDGGVAIDIETAAPQHWVHLNQDAVIAEKQRIDKHDKSGLDPYRSPILTLQVYAGGTDCFLFRHDALALVVHSHWLRRQTLLAHNAGMECKFLLHHANHRAAHQNGSRRGQLHCTMQAAGLLYGVGNYGEGRSLADAAAACLKIDVPKELTLSDWAAPILSKGQVAYACSDAIITWKLWQRTRPELARAGRWEAYQLQRRAVPAVAAMELAGLAFDRDEHARQTRLWDEELGNERQAFADLTKQAPPTKSSEVIAWLMRILSPQERERWPLTPAGQLSTRADHLKRLLRLDIAAVKPLLRIRQLEQLIRTFGPNLTRYINPQTGRLHANYNIAGTKSGRFSANAPNPQNLPGKRAPDFKRCIIARPDHVLICADYDQVEFRAAGRIAKEPALDRLYEEGRDLHRETAAHINGIPLAEVSKAQRDNVKCIGFGGIYGMGAASLREYAFSTCDRDMSEQQAKEELHAFFKPFPRLERWRKEHADRCQRRGYIEIGCGRVVLAEWEPYGLSFQQCCNLPIQGACADAMLRALQLAHRRLIETRVRGAIVASVHDELLLEVHKDDAKTARTLLDTLMVDAFTATFPGAPVHGLVKSQIGMNWAEAKG
jgi:DNA polymerase I-like protein with 3'-5' exonuclease and polymerase domains